MATLWKFLFFFHLCVGGFCCNSGWYPFQGKCYKASRNMYSVVMAKRYCQVSGGQLAYVNSTDTLRFLSGIPDFDSVNEYWVSDDSTLTEPTTTTSAAVTHEQESHENENTTDALPAGMTTGCRYTKILKINTEYCEEKKHFVCETQYPDQPDVCPTGFDHYGSNCYRAIVAALSNYEDANKYCVLQKSKLATLETEDKEWEAKAILLGKTEIFLVGATKYDGVLKWSNGVLFSPIHDMFANYSDGDCVGFLSGTDHPLVFSWAHVECEKRNGFLCETDLLPTTTTVSMTAGPSTTTLAPLTCPHGYNWKSHLDSGYCFWETTYETDRLNWFQARDFCKVYGGDLANYENSEQESTGLGGAAGHYKGLWFGLKRDENDVFHWSNGTTLSYSNWDYKEPNLKSRTKFCASHSAGSSRWELDYCGVRRWFICKAPKMRVTATPEYKPEKKIKCNITGASIYSSHWYKYQDHCYLIQDKADYTWDTARIFCQDNGGYLASIHSFQETDFVLTSISGYPAANYWIGLSANALESSFEWVDKTPLEFIYWSDSKEDDKNFTYCVDFDKRDGSWNVNHCSRFQGAICKRGINASYDFTTTEPMTIMSGNCEKGWYNLGNKCYKFFGILWSQRVTWNAANIECQKIGASLVSIHSKDEQEFLADVMLEVDSDVWIGMQSVDRGTLFHWSDDTRMDFTNWNDNEPAFFDHLSSPSFSPGYPSLCVIMENSQHIGKWNDIRCSSTHSYICQKMKDPANTQPYEDPFTCTNITGWYKLGSTCYGLFDQQNMTWMEAQKECQKYKADLITVKSAAVTFFMKRKLKLRNLSNPYFWIGVREKRPNNYEFVSHQTFLYDNWMAGQPKAASSYLDNCAAIQRDGRWIVRSCKERHPFICGTTAEDRVEPEVVIDRGHMCSNFTGYWQDFGSSNCYMFENDLRLSWADAMHYCFRHGGYLASFHSAEEVEKLVKLITTPYSFYSPSMHIGLGKRKDGSYAWVDNSAVDFTNWDLGEPPSASSKRGCVIMNIRNQKWRTIDCEDDDLQRGFICSAPKPSTTPFAQDQIQVTTQDKDIIARKITIGLSLIHI